MNTCVERYGFRCRYYFELAVGVQGLELVGGTWSIEGESSENFYEWQIARKYTSTGVNTKKRSKMNGIWQAWV